MDQDLNHFEISSQIETIKLLKGFYKNHKLAISGLTTCNYNWESTLRLIGLAPMRLIGFYQFYLSGGYEKTMIMP